MATIKYKDPATEQWVEIPVGGSSVTVDSALSSTSENPVQNKVINSALNGKQASLSADQLNACNSGITSAKVSTYDGYQAQINGKVSTTTYSAETRYGVAKIWRGTDNYLYIRTDGQ